MIQFTGCVANQWRNRKWCERSHQNLLENASKWKGAKKKMIGLIPPMLIKIWNYIVEIILPIPLAKSHSERGASHQPAFMSDCLNISHTCLPWLPSERTLLFWRDLFVNEIKEYDMFKISWRGSKDGKILLGYNTSCWKCDGVWECWNSRSQTDLRWKLCILRWKLVICGSCVYLVVAEFSTCVLWPRTIGLMVILLVIMVWFHSLWADAILGNGYGI